MEQDSIQEQYNDDLRKIFNDLDNIPELTEKHIGTEEAQLNNRHLDRGYGDSYMEDRLHAFYVAIARNFIDTAQKANEMITHCLNVSENMRNLSGSATISGTTLVEYKKVNDSTMEYGLGVVYESIGYAGKRLKAVLDKLCRDSEARSSLSDSDPDLSTGQKEEKADISEADFALIKEAPELAKTLSDISTASVNISERVLKNRDAQWELPPAPASGESREMLHKKVYNTASSMLSLQNARIELDLSMYEFLRRAYNRQDDTVKTRIESAMREQKNSLSNAFAFSDNIKDIMATQCLFRKMKVVSIAVPPKPYTPET